ncbi:hypothetical protein [Syntrophus gentianae]|uniref:hypothetical protein n=1 Tax=Syntrophus gentianae TaxID=43775 RepID=UPI00111462E6|nr:hypothetical protein [Syntrophus gentianae]
MKRVFTLILIFGLLGGCATQQSYEIPPYKTRGDFLLDKEVCENFSEYQGGYFDSGPLIVLFPIVKMVDFIEGNHQKDFQKCMTERGYHCTGGCFDTKNMDIKTSQAVQAEK